jgi:hypothetical protein
MPRAAQGVDGQSANLADSLPDVDCSLMGDNGLIRVIDVMREAGEHLHELRAQYDDRLQEELACRSARRSSAREMEQTGNSGKTGVTQPLGSAAEGWGKIEAASVAHTLAASLSWQILSIIEH